MTSSPSSLLPFLLSLTLLAACANPIMPSGGPPDTTPPTIVETSPAAGAVNASPSAIRITFSEYVDQNAFLQAFSINPEPEGRLAFDWGGRSVEVELPEDLRPNTTYILTLDTNLRDIHSVKLAQPITLAFSTGPRINRGRLAGAVVEASSGRPVAGMDVFAYAAPDGPPDPLPDRPDYRIQTGADGRFQFDYLSEGPYFVVALADRNRSRTLDVQEPFAPPPRPVLVADSVAQGGLPSDSLVADSLGLAGLSADTAQTDVNLADAGSQTDVEARRTSEGDGRRGETDIGGERTSGQDGRPGGMDVEGDGRPGGMDVGGGRMSEGDGRSGEADVQAQGDPAPTWFVTAVDTTRPALLEARALSARRFVLRYSEPVAFAEGGPDVWPLRDSADVQATVPAYPYVLADAPQQLFGLAADSLGAATYAGRTSAVVDTAGNAALDTAFAVAFLAEADTTRLRFRSFLPQRAGPADPEGVLLGPREAFGVQFNQPVDSAGLRAAVAVEDTTGAARAFAARTSDGTDYRLAIEPPLGPGEAVRVRVAGEAVSQPDTTFSQTFRRVTEQDLGALSGTVAVPPDTSGAVVVELYAAAEGADSTAFAPYADVRLGVDGRFLFERLPEGRYRFRAFLDRDGDGRWDGGRVSPYRRPEPLAWADAPAWRARWDSALGDTLRLPVAD